MTKVEHLFHFAVIVGAIAQGITGFGPDLAGRDGGGWVLFVHMCAAPLFIAGLTGTALLWARRVRFTDTDPVSTAALTWPQRCMFWVVTVTGFVVIASVVLAMWYIFGTREQMWLRETHWLSALVFLILMVVHTAVSLIADRIRRKVR